MKLTQSHSIGERKAVSNERRMRSDIFAKLFSLVNSPISLTVYMADEEDDDDNSSGDQSLDSGFYSSASGESSEVDAPYEDSGWDASAESNEPGDDTGDFTESSDSDSSESEADEPADEPADDGGEQSDDTGYDASEESEGD